MNAFRHHFSFEFRAALRNRSLLLLNYLFPLGFYLAAGSMMVGINPDFRLQIMPAMISFAVLSGLLLGMPEPLVSAREAGIFRNFKIGGVPALNLLLIPALTTGLHALIVAGVITVTSVPLFGADWPVHWPWFAAVTGATVLAHAGLGALVGVIATSTRVVVLWSQLVYLPSIMLGGLMVPPDMLPDTMKALGRLLPAAHGMNAYLSLALGRAVDFSPLLSLAALVFGAVLAFTLAVLLFEWDSRNRTSRLHPAAAILVLIPYLAVVIWNSLC